MIIRKFRKSDALECYLIFMEAEIKEVAKYYSQKITWNFLKRDAPKMMLKERLRLVATDKNSVVGYISAKEGKRVAKIEHLFVLLPRIGRGIGTKLLNKMENVLKKKGIKKVWLYSTISPHTRRFYEKNGYKNLGRKRAKLRGIKVPVFKMEKFLT